MTTGSMAMVDHNDVCGGIRQQRIDKGHADRTGADHEVVGLNGVHFRHSHVVGSLLSFRRDKPTGNTATVAGVW